MSVSRIPKKIVVVGGGIQGTSVAFELAERTPSTTSITILEAVKPASAASGKGGGFMARSWGNGSPTQGLHELAFDTYSKRAPELGCKTYRKLPVLSVAPGSGGVQAAQKCKDVANLLPSWLDGAVGEISPMGYGNDTAQITPSEYVDKMLQKQAHRIKVVNGICVGIETESSGFCKKVCGVKFEISEEKEQVLPADVLIISAGPWSCAAEDWFDGSVKLPMEGIKSSSIIWKQPEGTETVDATALFCGEDDRFGTHCKCPNTTPNSFFRLSLLTTFLS